MCVLPTDRLNAPLNPSRSPSRMDSSSSTACSPPPPPYAKERITAAVTAYRRLLQRCDAKTKAIAKLATRTPNSLKSNVDLKLSGALKTANPDAAARVSASFAAILAEKEAALHAVVVDTAQLELQALLAERDQCLPAARADLKSYFEACANAHDTFPPPAFDFSPPVPGVSPPNPSSSEFSYEIPPGEGHGLRSRRAIGNFNFENQYNLSIGFLDLAVQKLHYEWSLQKTHEQLKQKAAAEKKAAAVEMEVELPNSLLIGSLVKREIASATSALRKEVNQLRAALNSKTGGQGNPSGSNPPKPQKYSKTRKNNPGQHRADGEKVAAPPRAASKPPRGRQPARATGEKPAPRQATPPPPRSNKKTRSKTK